MLRYNNDLVSSSQYSEVTEEHLNVICGTIGNNVEITENIGKIKVDMFKSMIEGFQYFVIVFFLEKLMLENNILTRNYETLNDKIHDLNE